MTEKSNQLFISDGGFHEISFDDVIECKN